MSKKALDRLLAVVLLLSLVPLLILIALAVKATSRGPVFHRQLRIGLDGRGFSLLKFRSMTDTPAGAPEALVSGATAPGGVEGVDRRTAVGTWLRRTSLDELPQLINVLRGEMSLVGPRPERPQYVELFTESVPHYAARHRVPAGMTGLAQVRGQRGQTSIIDRVASDIEYIESWSLWLDLKILALTAGAVLRPVE